MTEPETFSQAPLVLQLTSRLLKMQIVDKTPKPKPLKPYNQQRSFSLLSRLGHSKTHHRQPRPQQKAATDDTQTA